MLALPLYHLATVTSSCCALNRGVLAYVLSRKHCKLLTQTLCMLCRDPYATFLAEYKRLRSHDYGSCSLTAVEGQACKGGHVSVMKRSEFNASDFR
jgi:hypothetical protein